MRLRAAILLGVMLTLIGFSISWAESESATRIADQLTVRWSSVQYHKSIALYNPEVSSTKGQTSESLLLDCEIEIGDPNLILGTSAEGVVTQLTDSSGLKLAVRGQPWAQGRSRQRYEGLRYDRRFTQPPQIPRWRCSNQTGSDVNKCV